MSYNNTTCAPERKQRPAVSIAFMMLGVLFCVCLIAANLLETKQIAFGPIDLTAGLIVFPVSYIINDCMVEVWGYRRAKQLIWMGFAMNFLFVFLAALCDALPAAPYWDNDEGFHAIFGLAPRITLASFVAFIAGSFVNAYVMSRMKIQSGGRNFSARAIMSTVYGEAADSIIFFPLALGGVVPLKELPILIISQVILKTLYEILVLPVTIRVVKAAKRHEGEDAYDNGINYSIWKVFSL